MFEAQMGMPIDEESGEPIDELALQKAHYERILSLQVWKQPLQTLQMFPKLV